jgi:hypothetical protein
MAHFIKSSYLIHIIIWTVSLSIFISILAVGFAMPVTNFNDPLVIKFSYGGYLHCYPSVDRDNFVFYFTYLIRTIVIGTCLLLLIIALTLFTNWRQLFILQWRIIVFMWHHLIVQSCFEVLTYYFNPLWLKQLITTVTEYPQCVASHPQEPNPTCPTDPISNGWYLHFYFLLRASSLILFCVYVYCTNYYYQLWWWIILTKRRRFTRADIATSRLRNTSNNNDPKPQS